MSRIGRLLLITCTATCLAMYVTADGYDFGNPATNTFRLPEDSATNTISSSSGQFIADEVNSYADLSQEIPQGYDYQPYNGVSANIGVGSTSGVGSIHSAASINGGGSVRGVGSVGIGNGAGIGGRISGGSSAGISFHLPRVQVETPANYEYSYGIHDETSGDIKSHSEARIGDVVRGMYSLIDADGYRRTVTYTVDGDTGFNAIVDRTPIGVVGPVVERAHNVYTQQQQQQQQQQHQPQHQPQHQTQHSPQQVITDPALQQLSIATAAREQQNLSDQAVYDSYAAPLPEHTNGPYA